MEYKKLPINKIPNVFIEKTIGDKFYHYTEQNYLFYQNNYQYYLDSVKQMVNKEISQFGVNCLETHIPKERYFIEIVYSDNTTLKINPYDVFKLFKSKKIIKNYIILDHPLREDIKSINFDTPGRPELSINNNQLGQITYLVELNHRDNSLLMSNKTS